MAPISSTSVVVVGGGILGVATAYFLAKKGRRDVVVLESEDGLGRHSTSRSVGYFIPMYESPAFARLAQASVDFLRNPPPDFSRGPLLHEDGAVIACTEAGIAAFRDELRQAVDAGVPIQELGLSALHDKAPFLRVELFARAAHYPTAGEIDVDALLSGFFAGAQDEGVRFLTGCSFVGLSRERGRITHVRTSLGNIECEHIVNAAGAWAGVVGHQCGASDIRFTVLRRHIVSLPWRPWERDRSLPFFRCPSIPMFIKPRREGVLLSPMDTVEDSPGDCRIDEAVVGLALESAARYTTLSVREASASIAGHRTFSTGKLPVVGPDTAIEGFHWAAGLGGAGIMAAPAVGDIVSDGILHGEQPAGWGSVAPGMSTSIGLGL